MCDQINIFHKKKKGVDVTALAKLRLITRETSLSNSYTLWLGLALRLVKKVQ